MLDEDPLRYVMLLPAGQLTYLNKYLSRLGRERTPNRSYAKAFSPS